MVPKLWMFEALVVDVEENGARTVKFKDGLRVMCSGALGCNLEQELGGCTAKVCQPETSGEEHVMPGCAGEGLLMDF